MAIQIEIPKDKQPRPEQEWGFTIWEFIVDNLLYLIAIILLLAIFFYARNYMRRH
jgi:hypothetical protein